MVVDTARNLLTDSRNNTIENKFDVKCLEIRKNAFAIYMVRFVRSDILTFCVDLKILKFLHRRYLSPCIEEVFTEENKSVNQRIWQRGASAKRRSSTIIEMWLSVDPSCM